MLFAPRLGVLRSHWRLTRPSLYLFFGRTEVFPTTASQLSRGRSVVASRDKAQLRLFIRA